MAAINWRTINVDLLDPESPANFDVSSLLPSIPSASASEVQTLSSQIKQLLRGGDSEGALKGALENAPYGGDAQAKVMKPPSTLPTGPVCAAEEEDEILESRKVLWEQFFDYEGQDVHLATIMETLQSIKQSEMSPMLSRIYGSEGGPETLDVLMKYL